MEGKEVNPRKCFGITGTGSINQLPCRVCRKSRSDFVLGAPLNTTARNSDRLIEFFRVNSVLTRQCALH